MEFKHYSVMKTELVNSLNIKSSGVYIDGTLGGGGHSELIVQKLGKDGRLICIDRDIDAIEAARKRLSQWQDKIILVKDNYSNIKEITQANGFNTIDGAIFDLGISSYQIDNTLRGFSYSNNAPLDMRMDQSQVLTAKNVVNGLGKQELKDILFEYGEERYADLIVRSIIKNREEKPIETTGELAEIIKDAVKKIRYDGGHPAKRTFQAIRIYVNDELTKIGSTLDDTIEILNKDGIISVLTFHSLEDRIVKKIFVKNEKPCICPPDFPVCVCKNKPKIKILTKKPLYPSNEEIKENPRSQSAKLRTAQKL